MPENGQQAAGLSAGGGSCWAAQLESRILDRMARPAVVGRGYVGLPLPAESARAGFRAVGIDLDARKVAQLRDGRSCVAGVPSREICPAIASGRVVIGTDYEILREAPLIVDSRNVFKRCRDAEITRIHAA